MTFDLGNLFDKNQPIPKGSIGAKVKKIRDLRGITQKELGIKCGFPVNSAETRIGQYEKNKKVPRENSLHILAGALEIDENALFDADLSSLRRAYHALFDIEEFFGLHPVEVDGNTYLGFQGSNSFDNISYDDRMSIYAFLNSWKAAYEKSLPSEGDTDIEKSKKIDEYRLWKYEFPFNEIKEREEKWRDKEKMRRLQEEMDLLQAKMHSDEELIKLDHAIEDTYKKKRETYVPLTKISELLLTMKEMLKAKIHIQETTVESVQSREVSHIATIKIDDITSSDNTKELYAEFLCHINALTEMGINISRRIAYKKENFYITFETDRNHFEFFIPLINHWQEMEWLGKVYDQWTDWEIRELEDKFLAAVTGEDDILLPTN